MLGGAEAENDDDGTEAESSGWPRNRARSASAAVRFASPAVFSGPDEIASDKNWGSEGSSCWMGPCVSLSSKIAPLSAKSDAIDQDAEPVRPAKSEREDEDEDESVGLDDELNLAG